MTAHACPHGSPRCGHRADILVRFDDGHTAWFCRIHATHVVHAHGATVLGKR